MATATRQIAFNKETTKSTKVIFIDEASTSTMDIDNWKILPRGSFTAADVKYQIAESLITVIFFLQKLSWSLSKINLRSQFLGIKPCGRKRLTKSTSLQVQVKIFSHEKFF